MAFVDRHRQRRWTRKLRKNRGLFRDAGVIVAIVLLAVWIFTVFVQERQQQSAPVSAEDVTFTPAQ